MLDLGFAERAEDDDVVDAIEKFRTEMLAQRVRNLFLDCLPILGAMLEYEHAADVRRHDDHGVSEIHRAPLRIRESTVVENLQKNVEHIRMRFFDLVKEQD